MTYQSVDEAKAAIDEHLTLRAEQSRLEKIDAKNKRFDLTDARRLDAMAALERLQGHVSLSEAVASKEQ